MKIAIKTRTVEELEAFDFRDQLEIIVNDKIEFCFCEGEPEDRTLSRDFNDCYNIPKLMKMAFNAGERGEGLIINGETIK